MQMTLELGAEHQLQSAQANARATGEQAAQACADKASRLKPEWRPQAEAWVLQHLEKHGPTSGEDLTDGCKLAGIHPHSDRAFGAVIAQLVREDRIERYGFGLRRKGHGTAGAVIWRIKRKGK